MRIMSKVVHLSQRFITLANNMFCLELNNTHTHAYTENNNLRELVTSTSAWLMEQAAKVTLLPVHTSFTILLAKRHHVWRFSSERKELFTCSLRLAYFAVTLCPLHTKFPVDPPGAFSIQRTAKSIPTEVSLLSPTTTLRKVILYTELRF